MKSTMHLIGQRLCLLVLTSILISFSSNAQVRQDSIYRQQRGLSGPVLPNDIQWFNTQKTFDVFDVADRFLLVHLWQPRQIESHVTMALMNEFHDKYPYIVVVSVVMDEHPAERSESNLNALIKTHKINHPVVLCGNDLSSLGLKELPSLPAVLGIRDNALSMGIHEGADEISRFTEELRVFEKGNLKELNLGRTRFLPRVNPMPWRPVMHFPGDIATSNRSQRIFIADAHNNRVIIVDEDGFVSDVIGTGMNGFRDGRFGAAQLNHPTGLIYDEEAEVLYISDTYNHALRSANLRTKEVKTLLGNGEREVSQIAFVDSTEQGLNFPTGLAMGPGKVVIAMTGGNQIWEYDIRSKRARVVAGDGKPTTLDGAREMSSFHAPRYITRGEEGQYWVTDLGSNTLRKVDMNWVVSTEVIENISDFPDLSLSGHAFDGKSLYLTDIYNNAILKFDKQEITELAGDDTSGLVDHRKGERSSFFHPVDVSLLNNELVVLDRSNNAVRKVNKRKGKTKTLALNNFDILFRNIEAYNEGYQGYFDELTLGKGRNTVHIELKLPDHLEWEDDGRMEVFLDYGGNNQLITNKPKNGFIEVECPGNEMNANINLQVYLTVRDKTNDQVYFKPFILFLPFLYDPSAPVVHDLNYRPFASK